MAGRVFRVHLVDRHDQALPKHPVPDAVDNSAGKKIPLAGLQRQLDQFCPGAELRRRRGLAFLAEFVEPNPFALLFVGGVMSLAWVSAIALFVLLEKTVPWGDRLSRLCGALLFVWGAISLVRMI